MFLCCTDQSMLLCTNSGQADIDLAFPSQKYIVKEANQPMAWPCDFNIRTTEGHIIWVSTHIIDAYVENYLALTFVVLPYSTARLI